MCTYIMVYSYSGILDSHEHNQNVVPHNSIFKCGENKCKEKTIAKGYDLHHPV